MPDGVIQDARRRHQRNRYTPLAKKNPKTAAIIGSGWQAAQLMGLPSGASVQIDTIRVFSPNPQCAVFCGSGLDSRQELCAAGPSQAATKPISFCVPLARSTLYLKLALRN